MDSDKKRLWARAIGDKLLVDGKLKYMLFFEGDEAFRGGPFKWTYKLFPTENGWHVVADELGNAESKLEWFACWKALYPDSDYILANWNWLHPHSREEATFILSRSPAEPQTCLYFKDKSIWTLEINERPTEQDQETG